MPALEWRTTVDVGRCYEVLSIASARAGGGRLVAPSEAETAAILDLTRVVAHAVERKAAPLVSYSVGGALAGVDAAGRLAFIAAAIAAIEAATDGVEGMAS
jgi:hypothetical protein